MNLKHFSIALVLLPLIGLAQTPVNLLDKRTVKKPVSENFSQTINTIDGRAVQNKATSNNNLPVLDGVKTEVSFTQADVKRQNIQNTAQATEQAFVYLKTNAAKIDPTFNPDNYTVFSSEIDALGFSHVKMQQHINGIEIEGCEIFVHFSGTEIYTHGIWGNVPAEFSTTPLYSKADAISKAEKGFQPEFGFNVLTAAQQALLHYTAPEVKTIITVSNGAPVLCYEVMVRPNMIERWVLKINASTGAVIEVYNNTCHIDGPKTGTGTDLNGVSRNINSYLIGSTYHLMDASKTMYNSSQSNLPDNPIGAIWTLDAGNTAATEFNYITSGSSNFSNTKGVSAHYNAGIAYDYFKTTFNRNSINGQGGTIISVINVANQDGSGLDNAYWNGQFMAYGNGNTVFKPLAGSLDVGGHEMTHGVVQNTANLEYKGQSGAINESMADIFGCMMDRNDWKLGEDIVKPGFYAGGALRDLQNPHNSGTNYSNGYQPQKMSEYYSGTSDNGGVHINSGIPNHAYYLFATSVTKEKAEQVYYRALTVYLTKTSQFKDLRLAVVQAAKDLYGTTEASAAATAFDAVEIYGPPVSGGGGTIGNNVADLPANPGQDLLLFYDMDGLSPYTISKTAVSPVSVSGQITRVTKKKPSVVDDGSYCVYVGSDGKIYSLLLDGSKTESILQNQAIWDNVAISKDGKRLAAITTNIDTSIYVYNFPTSTWKKFKLYNPTYSGVSAGGVQFADALEFDHSGTKIMYDAKSVINNQSGTDYSYWDVGIMNVWNLESNDWNDGTIEKLFSSLPDGVSIGNPVFSQRSPYIVAFDYVNTNTAQSLVTGYNLNTNKIGTVFTGSELGFPCFSRNDNVMVFNALNTSSEPVVAQKALAADKITGSGTATVLINKAKWGVWYSNGTRALLFSSKDILSFAFEGLSPQVTATITGTNITCTVPSTVNVSALTPSFSNSAYSYVKIGSVKQTSGVDNNNFTGTVVYTVVAQDGTTKNYNVTVTKSPVVGLTKQLTDNGIKIYPNPAIDELNIASNKPIEEIIVYNIQGQMVHKATLDNYLTVALDTKSLQTGMYILIIKTATGDQVMRFTKS